MSQRLTLELNDEIYAELEQQAGAAGLSVAEWIVVYFNQKHNSLKKSSIEAEREEARQRLLRYAGSIRLGHATGVDNEGIDADLARAYADNF